MYSTDGISWSNAGSIGGNWYSVTYGDGKFVAVSEYSSNTGGGGAEQVMYSSNGISWTGVNGIPTNQWCSVTYGNGKFVAVSNTQSNRVMYSTDAINWTSVPSADDNQRWWSITYADGKFVSVERDSNGKAMYSTDGINWSLASVPASSWRSITYGDGKFVAISGSGSSNDIMYSTDGINWTSTGQAQSQGWQSVTYGGDKFVAVTGSGTYQIMYSYDGITWEGDFTKLTLTNDKVFNSSDDTEMNTIDQVLTEGAIVDGTGGSIGSHPAFSATTYTGNSGDQTITTGIDNTGKSLIWIKNRSENFDHLLTVGKDKWLSSNTNNQGYDLTSQVTGFNSDGFSVSSNTVTNDNNRNYIAWNFRALPGFFDVVTWDGNGTNREIAHNLGSVPGFIMVKRYSASEDWTCYHKSLGAGNYIELNSTAASAPFALVFNNTEPTSTHFTIGTHDRVNTTGQSYVAYIFATGHSRSD